MWPGPDEKKDYVIFFMWPGPNKTDSRAHQGATRREVLSWQVESFFSYVRKNMQEFQSFQFNLYRSFIFSCANSICV